MLLVDDDESQPSERGKQRAARPDDNIVGTLA